ncbi:MAG: hypothetical protein K9K75_04575 [Deltaproteobacteria bacterium]|nr:hypothetical protein [Deltaproteobacteria bacterium]
MEVNAARMFVIDVEGIPPIVGMTKEGGMTEKRGMTKETRMTEKRKGFLLSSE